MLKVASQAWPGLYLESSSWAQARKYGLVPPLALFVRLDRVDKFIWRTRARQRRPLWQLQKRTTIASAAKWLYVSNLIVLLARVCNRHLLKAILFTTPMITISHSRTTKTGWFMVRIIITIFCSTNKQYKMVLINVLLSFLHCPLIILSSALDKSWQHQKTLGTPRIEPVAAG